MINPLEILPRGNLPRKLVKKNINEIVDINRLMEIESNSPASSYSSFPLTPMITPPHLRGPIESFTSFTSIPTTPMRTPPNFIGSPTTPIGSPLYLTGSPSYLLGSVSGASFSSPDSAISYSTSPEQYSKIHNQIRNKNKNKMFYSIKNEVKSSPKN